MISGTELGGIWGQKGMPFGTSAKKPDGTAAADTIQDRLHSLSAIASWSSPLTQTVSRSGRIQGVTSIPLDQNDAAQQRLEIKGKEPIL